MYPNTACACMKTFAMELMALFVLFSLPACATSYSALPISARVVDADTNEPLADGMLPTWRPARRFSLRALNACRAKWERGVVALR